MRKRRPISIVLLCDQVPQTCMNGVWAIVEYHTILMVAISEYLHIWKYFIFNAKHISAFPRVLGIF